MNYLVIDFGGTLAKYSVMDGEGAILTGGEQLAPTENKEKFISFVCDLYREVCNEYVISGVAISMPGVIDGDTGFLHTAGSYLALYGMDLTEELKDKIPVPVTVENDGKCGALAEAWKGNLEDCRDGIVLILGTGVAGGIIKDRRVHRGKHFSAGEFSYMLMDCEDNFRGTVLYKCSVASLLYKTCLKKGVDIRKCSIYPIFSLFMQDEQSLTEWNDRPEYAEGINGYQFFELLEQLDPDIQALYGDFTRNIARLVLNLQLSYDADKVLIGGGISRQPRLLEDIRVQYHELEKIYKGMYTVPVELDVCKFGNEANQYGALYHHLTHVK